MFDQKKLARPMDEKIYERMKKVDFMKCSSWYVPKQEKSVESSVKML